MDFFNPQNLFLTLSLPVIIGFNLIGSGLKKKIQKKPCRASLAGGFLFLVITIALLLYFSGVIPQA